MFKRFFSSSEIQKQFQNSKIDKTHTFVTTSKLADLALTYFPPTPTNHSKDPVNINISISNNLNNNININIGNFPKKKTKKQEEMELKKREFVKCLIRKVRDNCQVVRIKGLVVLHAVVKKVNNEELLEILMGELDQYILKDQEEKSQKSVSKDKRSCSIESQKSNKSNKSIQKDNLKEDFIHRHIISFYCKYLKKFIINKQIYQFIKNFNPLTLKVETDPLQFINKGFTILNLVNYILQSQSTFNKMGRYYLECHEVLNLFIMYLTDMMVYNKFIKELTNSLVKRIAKTDKNTMKHCYLFITEAQKTSDRLYQFFYNRYYYPQVKKMILIPTFLTLYAEQFKDIVGHVKKEDKQFLKTVKESKYCDEVRQRSKTLANIKSQDSKKKINRTIGNNQETQDEESFQGLKCAYNNITNYVQENLLKEKQIDSFFMDSDF